MGDAQVPLRQARRETGEDQSAHPDEAAADLARPLPYIASGGIEDAPQPQPPLSAPTRPSRASSCSDSGPATQSAKPNVAELQGGSVAFEDGASRRSTRSSTPLATTSPSRSSTPASSRLRRTTCRCTSGSSSRGSTPGPRLRADEPFPFVEFQSKVVAEYGDRRVRAASEEEMRAAIRADQGRLLGLGREPAAPHHADRPVPIRSMRRNEIPGPRSAPRAGRAARRQAPRLAALPERQDASFPSQGDDCAAWHWGGAGDDFETDAGRTCVVGTRDRWDPRLGPGGLRQAFAAAGRTFSSSSLPLGASTGEPRVGTPEHHRDDYRAAVRYARSSEGNSTRTASSSGARPGRGGQSCTLPPTILASPPSSPRRPTWTAFAPSARRRRRQLHQAVARRPA